APRLPAPPLRPRLRRRQPPLRRCLPRPRLPRPARPRRRDRLPRRLPAAGGGTRGLVLHDEPRLVARGGVASRRPPPVGGRANSRGSTRAALRPLRGLLMELRAVMRRFPSGVAVVTVDLEGERIGLTVSSLVSLSLDPPLVGLAVSRQAALHELLRRAGAFGVSLLGEGQEELATRFSRGVSPIALWTGVSVGGGLHAPLLDGSLGWIECETRAE